MTVITPSLSLEEMIAAAQQRRAKQHADFETEQQRRRQARIDEISRNLTDLFGDLVTMLSMTFEHGGYDSALACFIYEDRTYHLSHGRNCWHLTRMDERSEDDERNLPGTEVYANYRNDTATNQDALLLALVEVAALPVLPPLPPMSERVALTPEPTAEERFLSAFREMIRSETYNNSAF